MKKNKKKYIDFTDPNSLEVEILHTDNIGWMNFPENINRQDQLKIGLMNRESESVINITPLIEIKSTGKEVKDVWYQIYKDFLLSDKEMINFFEAIKEVVKQEKDKVV